MAGVDPRMVRTLRRIRAGDAGGASVESEGSGDESMVRSKGPSVVDVFVPFLYPAPLLLLLFCL